MLYDNLGVNDQGHLTVGGLDTVALAEEFGAPLYVLDEDQVRANCRTYRQAMAEWMPGGSLPLFAGKALCFKGLYPVLEEEGMGADVVSPGEIYTALAGGFPAEKLYFHGNNKTDEDIAYALDCGVGCFIVDNHQELERLEQAAGARSHRQRVLLRVIAAVPKGLDVPIDGKRGRPVVIVLWVCFAACFRRHAAIGNHIAILEIRMDGLIAIHDQIDFRIRTGLAAFPANERTCGFNGFYGHPVALCIFLGIWQGYQLAIHGNLSSGRPLQIQLIGVLCFVDAVYTHLRKLEHIVGGRIGSQFANPIHRDADIPGILHFIKGINRWAVILGGHNVVVSADDRVCILPVLTHGDGEILWEGTCASICRKIICKSEKDSDD